MGVEDEAGNPLGDGDGAQAILYLAPGTMSVLEAWTLTLSEIVAELAGAHFTRLTQSLVKGATTATVESTYGFDDANVERVLFIGGERMTWTALTSDTFTVIRDPDAQQLHGTGDVVEDASRWWSQSDKARADMMITRAEGGWLSILADRFGGEQRPPWEMTDTHFRELLRVLVYLDRGTFWALWRVLMALLVQWMVSGTDGVTAAGTPQRLSSVGVTFGTQMVHRYVEVAGLIYRIVDADEGGAWVDLDAGGGPWWVGAAFGTATGVKFDLIPFVIEEDWVIYPATVVIHALIPMTETIAPPTYLQPAGAADTPVADPKGGELMVDENDVADGNNQPFYIAGDIAGAITDILRDVLVLGAAVIVLQEEP